MIRIVNLIRVRIGMIRIVNLMRVRIGIIRKMKGEIEDR